MSSRRPETAALRRVPLDSPAIAERRSACLTREWSRSRRHADGSVASRGWLPTRGRPSRRPSTPLVSCRVGEVGIAVLAEDGSTPVASEAIVPAGVTRLVTALLDRASEPGRWLMIRNGAAATASECDVFAVFTGDVPSVELTNADVALALRNPAAAKESCVRRAWPEDVSGEALWHRAPARSRSSACAAAASSG